MPTIRLTWNDNSSAETEQRIYRSTSTIDPNALPTPLATIAADATSYDDTTVVEDTYYCYRVSAVGALGEFVSGEMCMTANSDPTDPHWASVVLLVGMDGTDGSTTFVDESPTPKTLTGAGGVVKRTATKQFGTASAEFDGADDHIATPDDAGWHLSGAFTIEAWVNFSTVTATSRTFIAQYSSSTNSASWMFLRNSSGQLNFLYFYTGTEFDQISAAWTPTAGQFYHVVAERNASNVLRLYVDGVMLTSKTGAAGMFDGPNELRIGARSHVTPNRFAGYIDEVRITKGVARYDSNTGYTVPTAAFPRG